MSHNETEDNHVDGKFYVNPRNPNKYELLPFLTRHVYESKKGSIEDNIPINYVKSANKEDCVREIGL